MTIEYIPLPQMQRDIMQLFYNIAPTKIIFDKKQRKELWKQATRHEKLNFTQIIRTKKYADVKTHYLL